MKKVLSVFLAAVMVFTLSFAAAMFVSADGEPTIVVSSQSAARGETKDVTISLKNNPGVATMKIKVDFPSDLSLVSSGSGSHGGNYIPDLGDTEYETTDFDNWVKYDITEVRGTAHQPETATSPVTLNWVCLSDLSEDVIFATLKFKVDDAAEFGDKDITVTYENGDISDIDENDVNFSIQNGKITVVCTHNFTETVNNECLKTHASCTQKAVYYKSCSICGEKSNETFESGDFLAHTLGAWESDSTSHWKTCSSCRGQFESANHTESDWIIDTPATVGNDGQKHKECTVCGRVLAAGTIPALPQPKITVESKKVAKGNNFTVEVNVQNNPGFAYLELTPTYSEGLTLVSVENGELISDFTKGNQYVWVADEDVTGNGLLMTFTFSTTDATEPGEYDVGFSLRGCVNYSEENVNIVVETGKIDIINFVYGDANGDCDVNGQDIIRLKKYLANYDYETGTSTIEISAGADANGDGDISGQDIIRLKKYLANYDYDTGTSTIILGPQN